MPPSGINSLPENMVSLTRRNRVAQMRKTSNTKAQTLKRGIGTRFLVNRPKQFQIANETNVFGTNFNNTNVNKERSNNLRKSRFSGERSRPRYPNVRLNEKQAKLFANLSAAYNEPEEMLETLKKFQQRIYAMYAN